MLQVHLIYPNDREKYRDLLAEAFVLRDQELFNALPKKKRKKGQPAPILCDTPEAIYLVFTDSQKRIWGSAHLHPSAGPCLFKMLTLEEWVENAVLWELCSIVVHLPKEYVEGGYEEEGIQTIQFFYQYLYRTVQNFCLTEGIETVIVVSPIEEHENINFFGNWPWTLQSKTSLLQGEVYGVGVLSFSTPLPSQSHLFH